MAVPASKVNVLIDKLNVSIVDKIPLGDIDRYHVEKFIQDSMTADPMWALTLRGMLAHIDGMFEEATRDMEQAVALQPRTLVVRCNFATILAESGDDELAVEQVRRCLALSVELNDWEYLDGITTLAVGLGDMDTVAAIISVANKLNICTPIISQAAVLLCAEGEGDAEAVQTFGASLTDEYLPALSKKISNARWAEMESFADELSSLVK